MNPKRSTSYIPDDAIVWFTLWSKFGFILDPNKIQVVDAFDADGETGFGSKEKFESKMPGTIKQLDDYFSSDSMNEIVVNYHFSDIHSFYFFNTNLSNLIDHKVACEVLLKFKIFYLETIHNFKLHNKAIPNITFITINSLNRKIEFQKNRSFKDIDLLVNDSCYREILINESKTPIDFYNLIFSFPQIFSKLNRETFRKNGREIEQILKVDFRNFLSVACKWVDALKNVNANTNFYKPIKMFDFPIDENPVKTLREYWEDLLGKDFSDCR